MRDNKDNIIYKKSFEFAVKIVRLYKSTSGNKSDDVLFRQLLRSGTSIVANIREGLEGQSKKDFISKLSIALKEACETEYWIELLVETGYIGKDTGELLLKDVSEIIKILNSILKTFRAKLNIDNNSEELP